MIEDLDRLRAELDALDELPPVLDDSEGPLLVKAVDVLAVAGRILTLVEKLTDEAYQTAERLRRYDQLKRYTRQLEQVVAAQRRKLAVVAEVATTTPTSGAHR